jgi:hypothetical protein
MRYLAAIQLGWTQIEAEVIVCTLEEAKDRANFSNNQNPPFWLDKYEGWAARFAAHPEWNTQADMAAHLGVAERWVGRCINLLDVLNEDARRFIKESVAKGEGNNGLKLSDSTTNLQNLQITNVHDNERAESDTENWELLEDHVFQLTRLVGNRGLSKAEQFDRQAQAFKILQIAKARQMKAQQVAEVAKWVKAGNRPEDYSPQKVSEYLKNLKPVTAPPNEPSVVDSPAGAEPQTQPAPHIESNPHPVQPPVQGHGITAPGPKKDPGNVSVFWGTLAGMPWIKTIRAKIKAGQDPTLWEKLFLAAAFLFRCFVWVWNKTWPWVKKVLGWVLRFLKESVHGVVRLIGKVVGKPVEQVLQVLVFLSLIVGVVMFFLHPAGVRDFLKGLAWKGVHGAESLLGGSAKPQAVSTPVVASTDTGMNEPATAAPPPAQQVKGKHISVKPVISKRPTGGQKLPTTNPQPPTPHRLIGFSVNGASSGRVGGNRPTCGDSVFR